MLPSNTNNTSPCTPVSSNCVIWQGPDIPCIDLCNGDTISDVVAKLAEELCNIIDAACSCNPDLEGLDISCMTDVTPDGLVATLQTIIDYTCNLDTGGTKIEDYIVNLPKCLHFRDDRTGNLVTSLPFSEWTDFVGNALCDIETAIRNINTNITNINQRISVLEACVLPCEPTQAPGEVVISQCLFPGEEVPLSTLVLAIESKFCQQTDATGDVSVINSSISAQSISGKDETTSTGGTFGEIGGWVSNVKNLAESSKNQWLAIGDLYAATKEIKASLPKDCDATNFVFTYNPIDSTGSGVPDAINLNFQGTSIPAGFTDCNGNTVVTVTDSEGGSTSQNINVSGLIDSLSGVNISIESLNRFSSLNLSIPFCVTDGNCQCADKQQVIIPLTIPCPSSVTAAYIPTNSILVSFINQIGSDVSYEITATSQTSGGVLGTTVITNPPSSIDYTFTGATEGDTYDIQVTVIGNRNSRTSCPVVEVAIPGTICTDVEVTTPSATSPALDNVFLGLYDNGVTVTRYWYDRDLAIIRSESVGATVPCDSPILTNPVMDYLGTPGDVAVDVSYGTEPSPTDFQISWSIDDITYNGLTSYAGAPVNPVVIATGQTSGSVYIKVETTCTGPLQSIPTIIRYDFNTGVWTTLQSPQECAETSLTRGCPAGIEVARQILECGINSYTVFGGSADSYWFYAGKIQDPIQGPKYIYAGWDNNTGSVRSVVECCTCPTFILSDPIQVLCGIDGDSVDITLPYVLGAGEPDMSVIVNPVLGTVTQGAIANQFTYTTVNPSGSADYADTFQVQLQPTIPGTGNCSLDTFTVQIQTIASNVQLEHTDSDIYVFLNTNGLTSFYGTQIKTGLSLLQTQWQLAFGWTGDFYFIPTDSKNWAAYPQAIVDDGASWVQSADLAWQALEELPTSWPGGTGVGVYKNSAFVIVFSNDSSGIYHDSTLAAGYGSGLTAQPTVNYKDDFDALTDMLDGTQTSLWAQNLGITENVFPNGLSLILYPMIVNGSGSADAATALQMISAYTAELIPASKYGIKTAPDLTNYILQGVASTMPYTGATTPSNTITQLFSKTTLGTLALLDQEYSADEFTKIKDNEGRFQENMTRAIKGPSDAYPATTIPAVDVYEVQDCAGVWAPWFVRITDNSCGSIANGLVVKLNNPGATFPASGGRPEWASGTNKCVTIVDNCSGTPLELAVDLVSSHPDCGSCTP